MWSLDLDEETTVPSALEAFDAGGNCEISMMSLGGTNLAGSGSDRPVVASVTGIPFNRSTDCPSAAVRISLDEEMATAIFASSVFPVPLYDTGRIWFSSAWLAASLKTGAGSAVDFVRTGLHES
jgi:hypothetical protein